MTSFNPQFTITNRMTSAITQIERARGFLEAAQLSEDWVRDMGTQALIKEAHHTTHIEGTRLTLDQAERLWKGETVPEADPDDARELLNYRSAFEFVSECLDSGDPITEGKIREIHRKLVEGVRGGKADPGNYRRVQNYIANSSTGEERGTASLTARLEAAKKCESWGYKLAFHFDPLVIYPGCEKEYEEVVQQIFAHVKPENILWISIGTFRFIPALKQIVQQRFPDSTIAYGEFITGLDNKMRYFKPLKTAA